MSEKFFDLAAELMFAVNKLMNHLDVPAELRAEVCGKRDALACHLAEKDAGLNRFIWGKVLAGVGEEGDAADRQFVSDHEKAVAAAEGLLADWLGGDAI